MKARALILTTLVFLAADTALAQRVSDIPSISTSGTATVKVVPDQIEISLSVESMDAVLAKAKAANDADVARVLAAARKRISDPEKIQTDFMQVSYVERTPSNPAAYEVRKSIVIESNDIAGFEALVADLLGAGANRLHGIRFMTSALRTHRDEARRLAIKAALEKAQMLAASLGKKVGMARHISEGADSWWSSYGGAFRGGAASNTIGYANDGGGSADDSTLAPGRISVTASVSVIFDLE